MLYSFMQNAANPKGMLATRADKNSAKMESPTEKSSCCLANDHATPASTQNTFTFFVIQDGRSATRSQNKGVSDGLNSWQ